MSREEVMELPGAMEDVKGREGKMLAGCWGDVHLGIMQDSETT